MNQEGPIVWTAARCVSFRDLARSTAALAREVEIEGKVIAISRYGRIVALLSPLPERLILEFEEGTPIPSPDHENGEAYAPELSSIATEFLIDAASTPTGYWSPPDSALGTYKGAAIFRALDELVSKQLAEWESGTKIRVVRQGRRVAKALREQGAIGYGEAHGEHYLED